MANLFSSSIGRKFLMSISGLFLILFLIVHLTANSFLILDWAFGTETGQMFNAASHFMATNPLIKVVEPVLALGFAVHIIYSLIISFQNLRARGNQKYQSGNNTQGVEWASKNMLVLGIAIFAFLAIHIYDFYLKMRGYRPWHPAEVEFPFFGLTATGENAYTLVNDTFSHLWVVIVYVIGSVALAFHLAHGFWSAFQTIGWNNTLWLKRLRVISLVIAWIIGGGFSVIAVAQYLFF
ncbi:succinate dehydrogenase cytochrome b subunit [Saccharicrinis sp. FJH54]|uniref:succinate dehydrogenase cytochrome b subunit n=1 Tax=Saccharicrinis sp. FJH54 TaxID=3344665 RepID=UPI0035D48B76